MYVRYAIALVVALCISCTNDFFPAGLYDYQVERLLSGGGAKAWDQVVNSENCADSIRLYIQLLASTADDSVLISEIVRGSGCNPDTTVIGTADASSFSDAIVFTDSLNFSDGNSWIVQRITSASLSILKPSETVNYSSD